MPTNHWAGVIVTLVLTEFVGFDLADVLLVAGFFMILHQTLRDD